MGNLPGIIFLLGGGNLILPLKSFSKLKNKKQILSFANIEHWLKSQLTWPVFTKSIKVKWKLYRGNEYC